MTERNPSVLRSVARWQEKEAIVAAKQGDELRSDRLARSAEVLQAEADWLEGKLK